MHLLCYMELLAGFVALVSADLLTFCCYSSWSNKIITSTDTGSVQINVGHVDPVTGCYTGKYTPIALCGFVRSKGDSDTALAELVRKIDSTSD